jgi:hypothetical protein
MENVQEYQNGKGILLSEEQKSIRGFRDKARQKASHPAIPAEIKEVYENIIFSVLATKFGLLKARSDLINDKPGT